MTLCDVSFSGHWVALRALKRDFVVFQVLSVLKLLGRPKFRVKKVFKPKIVQFFVSCVFSSSQSFAVRNVSTIICRWRKRFLNGA